MFQSQSINTIVILMTFSVQFLVVSVGSYSRVLFPVNDFKLNIKSVPNKAMFTAMFPMMVPRVAASGECGGGLGAVAPAVGDEGPQHVAVADDFDDDEVVADDDEDVVIDNVEGVGAVDVVLFVAVCEFDNFKSLDLIITVAEAEVVGVAVVFTKTLSPTTSISSSSSMVDRRDFVSISFFGINCMLSSGVEELGEDNVTCVDAADELLVLSSDLSGHG
ncbi:hypothetical protein FF38_10739 [Lucilia cuprina]|uniref:Uncharacterized protein n=1 Tax=Lucilia cuprina TaxID=7375 RepID=A0A0L0BTI4_LUCCU|nr:hypothetical protein FF38_10739 [Lucilia cuprina]